jgi:rubrerythrin
MSKSEKNLKEAFAGESQANRKYLAFARQAEKEGLKQVAKLFRATAEAETVHALTHLQTLKGVGQTVENLKAAIAGETFEFSSMYPKMIEEAEAEGDKQALRSFRYANEVEKIHAALYEKALADPAGLKDGEYYICSVCGYTCEDHAPDKCPVCQAAAKAFYSVG